MTLINTRLGEEIINNQGCPAKIVEYRNAENIVVEFQSPDCTRVKSTYQNFKRGSIKNPYYPSICGVGSIGNKYKIWVNGKHIREYVVWRDMLERCYDKRTKNLQTSYRDVTCCKEWLLFDNFYEWIHAQPNFDKWLSGHRVALDKDILHKGNKIYSPENCCLVPQYVNCLFLKKNASRGNLPIGVSVTSRGFEAKCGNPETGKAECLGVFKTEVEAFNAYKVYKEKVIKEVAEKEFRAGNITSKCYEAMMRYSVSIDD